MASHVRIAAVDKASDAKRIEEAMKSLDECLAIVSDIAFGDESRHVVSFAMRPIAANLKELYEQLGWLEFAVSQDETNDG
jgi:hypothetical protein